MTTRHSIFPFISLCTALILLCYPVPAQAQSEAPANEQNADIPVEWFRLLPAQAGEAVLAFAKRQLSGRRAGVQAAYVRQRNDRPEAFLFAIVPYSDALRNRMQRHQPMDTEGLPEGTEAFTDSGRRGAAALNEQMGYAAWVDIGPGASERTLSDAAMRLPISVMERASNEATQPMDASVGTGIGPLLAALPLRPGDFELLEIQIAEPGTSQLGATVNYAVGPEQEAAIELLVCPGTAGACLGERRAAEMAFIREQAPSLATDTTLSGTAVTLFRAGEATRTSPGVSIGASNQNPGLLASENETLVFAFAREVSMEQFMEAVEQLDIAALLELAPGLRLE
jgi:hypothetical protein